MYVVLEANQFIWKKNYVQSEVKERFEINVKEATFAGQRLSKAHNVNIV